MVRVLSLLFIFMTASAQAAVQPAGVPMYTLGATADVPAGMAALALSQLSGSGSVFTLQAMAGASANNHAPFRISGASYKVPTGKNANCFAIVSNSAIAGVGWQLMQATGPFVEQTASPTGAVYQYGASANLLNYTSSTTYRQNAHPWTYIFPPGTWPGIQYAGTNNAAVFMQCTETAVQ